MVTARPTAALISSLSRRRVILAVAHGCMPSVRIPTQSGHWFQLMAGRIPIEGSPRRILKKKSETCQLICAAQLLNS
jgi:hypothetical protein